MALALRLRPFHKPERSRVGESLGGPETASRVSGRKRDVHPRSPVTNSGRGDYQEPPQDGGPSSEAAVLPITTPEVY